MQWLRRNHVQFLFLLALLGFLFHGVSIPNPYYYDDIEFIESNPWVGNGPGIRWYQQFFWDGEFKYVGYRPTLMLSYDLNAQILGKNPASFRIINLLIHICNAFLIFLLVLPYLKFLNLPKTWTAFFIAGIFMVHPLQTLPINFLWKRSTLLSEFFLLSALLLHRRAREQQGYSRLLWHVIELLVLFLALTSKESAVVYIFFVLLFDFFHREPSQSRRADFIFSTFLASILGAFTYWRIFVLEKFADSFRFRESTSGGPAPGWIEDQILIWKTNAQTFVDYAFQLMAPKPLLLDDAAYSLNVSWIYIFTFILLISLPLILFIKIPKARFFIGAIMAFFWLPLAPTTTFVHTTFIKDQVRLYLPVLSFSILTVLTMLFFFEQKERQKLCIGLLVLVVATLGGVSFMQNLRYREPLWIWSDVLKQYPASAIAFDNIGMILTDAGRNKEAISLYQNAAAAHPNKKIYSILELVNQALSKEDPTIIEERLNEFDEKQLGFSEKNSLGYAYFLIHKLDRAEAIYLDLLHAQPFSASIHMMLAYIWFDKKDLVNARQACLNVLKIDPTHTEAKKMLSRLEAL